MQRLDWVHELFINDLVSQLNGDESPSDGNVGIKIVRGGTLGTTSVRSDRRTGSCVLNECVETGNRHDETVDLKVGM